MCINLRSETHRNKVKDKSSELCEELIQLYLKALYNKENIHLLKYSTVCINKKSMQLKQSV